MVAYLHQELIIFGEVLPAWYIDTYENCTCKCLNYYSVFIAITIGKPCFKSIKAIIGAYVVTPFKILMYSNITCSRNIVSQGGKVYNFTKRLHYL